MNLVRDFFLPLIPFFIELVLRLWMVGQKDWWYYLDSGTLLLTFSVWSLLVLSSVPNFSRIERDDEVLKALEKVRNHFGVLVTIGFILFGLVVFVKVSIERSAATEFADQDMQMLAVLTLLFALYCCFYIAANRKQINRLIEG